MLDNGEHDVPPGKVAAIVTHLDMRVRPDPRPVPDPEGVTLERLSPVDPARYLALFRGVGGDPWLWFSRLVLARPALDRVVNLPGVHVHVLRRDGADIGMVELDFRVPGACALAYFGLVPEAVGSGLGRWMMNRAIALAWVEGIERFHVHTCTLDHPAALSFYRRSGFVPVRQQVEIADDPRLEGILPDSAAPHVPLFPLR